MKLEERTFGTPYITSNIMWYIERKVYRNIKNALCILAYLPAFLVILDTVIIT